MGRKKQVICPNEKKHKPPLLNKHTFPTAKNGIFSHQNCSF